MSDSAPEKRIFLPFTPNPDRDSKPYWAALSEGHFRLQRCSACRALRWPARAFCNRCRSFECEWQDQDGDGQIVSWVRTHQSFAPELRDAVPYYVVQVALRTQSDLVLIGGWLVDREPVYGEAVDLEIIEGAEGFKFPCWKPAA